MPAAPRTPGFPVVAPAAVVFSRPLLVLRRPGDPGSAQVRLERGCRARVVVAPSGRVWGLEVGGSRFVADPRAVVAASRPCELPAPAPAPVPAVQAVLPLEVPSSRRTPVRGLAPAFSDVCPCSSGGPCRVVVTPALEAALRTIESGPRQIRPSLAGRGRRR